MVRLSFVSLNIENDRHLAVIIPFLERMDADVVCLQELFKADIPQFEAICGPCFFVPMVQVSTARGPLVEGVGIFSRLSMRETAQYQYAGHEGSLGIYDPTSLETKMKSQRFVVALATVQKDGADFRVAATHFPWTADGEMNDFQRMSVPRLFATLESEKEFVLCGDFNAPRGREIFSLFAEKWKDNIPAHYASSLDGALHRSGPLPYMVDGLFSTPAYRVSEVELHVGVSDHCAISASIDSVSS